MCTYSAGMTGWCHMKLLPSRRVLCTPYKHTPCHFMQSHIRKVHACLAVTCHLHFWQNDRALLRATAVTRDDTDTEISQHRKSTLEKKILPPLLQGFEPATFPSRVRRSNHWAIPTPHVMYTLFCQCLFFKSGQSVWNSFIFLTFFFIGNSTKKSEISW